MPYFARYDITTNLIDSVGSHKSIPSETGLGFLEVTQKERDDIVSNFSHPQGGKLAWAQSLGNLVGVSDTRKVIQINLVSTEVSTIAPVRFTIRTLNADMSPDIFNGTQKIGISLHGQPVQKKRILINNGNRTFDRIFQNSGSYEIINIDAGNNYRLIGDLRFDVLEDI